MNNRRGDLFRDPRITRFALALYALVVLAVFG
jgi:hypothetical protein